LIDPRIGRETCLRWIEEDFVADLLATATGQTQAILEEDRIVLVEAVGRELVLLRMKWVSPATGVA